MKKLRLFNGSSINELASNLEKGLFVNLPHATAPEATHRLVILADDSDLTAKSQKALAALRAERLLFEDGIYVNPHPLTQQQACLLFPGQGSQYLGMLNDLKKVWPGFDSCYFSFSEILSHLADRDFNKIIDLPATAVKENNLKDTRNAQPALALCSSALAMALKQLNIIPQFAAGHSFGELAALWSAEAFSLETLFRLALARGELFHKAGTLAPGGMLSIMASAERAAQLASDITPTVFVANINSPQQTIVSGHAEGINKLYELCKSSGIRAMPIPTSGAFHSPCMQPVLAAWSERVAGIIPPTASIHLKKNVSSSTDGRAYDKSGTALVDRLVQQLIQPMNWVITCQGLYNQGVRLFIEVGPAGVLTKFMNAIFPDQKSDIVLLTCDPEHRDPQQHLSDFLAKLYVSLTLSDSSKVEQLLMDLNDSPRSNPLDAALNSDTQVGVHTDTQQTFSRIFSDGNSKNVESFLASQDKIIDFVASRSDSFTSAQQNQLLTTIAHANSEIIKEYFDLQNQTVALLRTGAKEAHSTAAMSTQRPSYLSPPNDSEPRSTGIITEEKSPDSSMQTWLMHTISELVGIKANAITPNMQFESDLGLDSLRVMELMERFMSNFPQHQSLFSKGLRPGCISDIMAALAGGLSQDELMRTTSASAPKASAKEWLVSKVSKITGIPAAEIKSHSQFEADLGLDSLRIIELFDEFLDQFPRYKNHHFTQIRCVDDILKELDSCEMASLTHKDAVKSVVTLSANPLVTEIYAKIKERLALAAGTVETTIKDSDDFYVDLKLNAFIIDQIISDIIAGNPQLIFLGQELSNINSLNALNAMLAKGYDHEGEKETPTTTPFTTKELTALEDHMISRYVFADSESLQIPVQGTLAKTVLLVGENNQFYQSFENKITKLLKVERLYLAESCWYSPKLDRRVAAHDEQALWQLLTELTGDCPMNATIFLAASPYQTAPTAGGFDSDLAQAANSASARLFMLAKALSPLIKAFSDTFTLATVTRDGDLCAWYGVEGVSKALSHEWPQVRVRHLRLHCELNEITDINLLRILLSGPSECNISLAKDGLVKTRLQKSVLDRKKGASFTPFIPDDIVICTGGGRGITAQAAMMLARKYRCHIVAIGLTDMPQTLPFPQVTEEESLYDVVKAELGKSRDDEPLPKEILRQVNQISRQRELYHTARRIEQSQGRFSYYKADVRSKEQLKCVIDDVKAKYGSITGIIHGAGMIKDALIEKKSLDDFETVFQTKVHSLAHLKELTKDEPLKIVVVFSSIVAFTGTPGQTDYVAANVLVNHLVKGWNKSVNYPVKAILWSAWHETGLVTESLKRQMGNLRLHGIRSSDGTTLLEQEIELGRKDEDLVLISTGSVLKYTLSSDSGS